MIQNHLASKRPNPSNPRRKPGGEIPPMKLGLEEAECETASFSPETYAKWKEVVLKRYNIFIFKEL